LPSASSWRRTQLPPGPFDATELYGELSLGGELHPIRGVLPTALQGMRAGHTMIFPAGNLGEAALARHGARARCGAAARGVRLCAGAANVARGRCVARQ
jgi:predicted ATPase with chaperone activity